MERISITLGAFALTIALATQGFADPKPKGAKPPDAQSLANIYVGRTDEWTTCSGGIYYGGKWQAQATCTKDGDAVGLGTWSVDRRGRICWKLTWYWPDGDGVGSKPEKPSCISHLVDASGSIWRKWDSDTEWWQLDTSEKKAFKFKRPIRKLRRQLKI